MTMVGVTVQVGTAGGSRGETDNSRMVGEGLWSSWYSRAHDSESHLTRAQHSTGGVTSPSSGRSSSMNPRRTSENVVCALTWFDANQFALERMANGDQRAPPPNAPARSDLAGDEG